MGEKTEKATPKKMRDARKKGQVAKSQDFPSAFTFVVSIGAVLASAHSIFEKFAAFMISIFQLARYPGELSSNAAAFMVESLSVIAKCSIPILILTLSMGVMINFLIVGPLFTFESMKPDIKKLNPLNFFKNLFKVKTIFELAKSLLKITGAVVIVYFTIKQAIPEILQSADLPVSSILTVFATFLKRVIIRVGIFFGLVAIADLVFQKRNFANEMKMEKFEVKQEYKDTEGDPHIKSRRRQTAHEIAYSEGPRAVKRAKTVITNPTHIAVALEFEEGVHNAPIICVMGQGPIADKIIDLAYEYNVPIMRNVPLAQDLFAKGKVGQYVPRETWDAITEILKWLKTLENEKQESSDMFQ